jgi:hypothetical protein
MLIIKIKVHINIRFFIIFAKSETASKKYTQLVLYKDFILNGKLICKYDEESDIDMDFDFDDLH